jgi:hypothetical protein
MSSPAVHREMMISRQGRIVSASYTADDLAWLDDNLDEMLADLDAAEQQQS